MNKHQTLKIEDLTTRLSRLSVDGALSFSIQTLQKDEILIVATNSNSDLRWYESISDFYAIIGPRGGVRQYDGNLSI